MKLPSDIVSETDTPKTFSKLNDWKASILQSVLLFFSFALITVGVALEAGTPMGLMNGFWALNLVIPSTGFMLSLANWYFVRIYKNRKLFSNCSLLVTLFITICAYIWSGFHYEAGLWGILWYLNLCNGIGVILSIVFCALSKILSNIYAKMLGKE